MTATLNMSVDYQYSFTIEAKEGQLECAPMGNVPGGVRLHLSYVRDAIRFFRNEDAPAPHMEGTIVNGSDWLLLREDGVAVFDGRVTFRGKVASPSDNNESTVIFDGIFAGAASLLPLYPKGVDQKSATIYQVWPDLHGPLDVAIPVRFETPGPKQDWLSKELKKASEGGELYRELAMGQFLALGTVNVVKGLVQSANLTIGKLSPTKRARRE